MYITEKTTYICGGKKFDHKETAILFCNEHLAENIETLLMKGIILSPKDRLKLLENIENITDEQRQILASNFVINFETQE